jgi:hypothetical protein
MWIIFFLVHVLDITESILITTNVFWNQHVNASYLKIEGKASGRKSRSHDKIHLGRKKPVSSVFSANRVKQKHQLVQYILLQASTGPEKWLDCGQLGSHSNQQQQQQDSHSNQ